MHDHAPEVTSEDEFYCPDCAANEAVAPFVAWLRDAQERPIEDLLLAQAIAICALERLGATNMVAAAWPRLRVEDLMLLVRDRCFPEPSTGELRTMIARLFAFLEEHDLLSRRDRLQLRRQLRRACLRSTKPPH